MVLSWNFFFWRSWLFNLPEAYLQEFQAAVKVSKFQKQIFLFSFEPKNERNCFFISALASKNGSNQKN